MNYTDYWTNAPLAHIHSLTPDEVQHSIKKTTLAGGMTLQLNGKNIHTEEEYLQAINQIIPLDPPHLYVKADKKIHWDAFTDSLFGGINLLSTNRLLLIWNDARTMEKSDLVGFKKALSRLNTLVPQLANSETGTEMCTQLEVVLVE